MADFLKSETNKTILINLTKYDTYVDITEIYCVLYETEKYFSKEGIYNTNTHI